MPLNLDYVDFVLRLGHCEGMDHSKSRRESMRDFTNFASMSATGRPRAYVTRPEPLIRQHAQMHHHLFPKPQDGPPIYSIPIPILIHHLRRNIVKVYLVRPVQYWWLYCFLPSWSMLGGTTSLITKTWSLNLTAALEVCAH
eukprot:2017985-Amphidinium_carterae.1